MCDINKRYILTVLLLRQYTLHQFEVAIERLFHLFGIALRIRAEAILLLFNEEVVDTRDFFHLLGFKFQISV